MIWDFVSGQRARFIVVFIASGLLLACTSLHKQAEEQVRVENYSGAEKIYRQILDKEPGDVVAKEQLNRVRERMLNSKLMDTREARLAGKAEAALESLKVATELITEWNLDLIDDVDSVYAEEIKANYPFYKAKIEVDVARQRADDAAEYMFKYRNVFRQGPTKKMMAGLENRVLTLFWDKNQQRIRQMVKAKFPLAARVQLDKFVDKYGDDYSPGFEKKLKLSIAEAGGRKCRELLAETRGAAYASRMVAYYCGYWGIDQSRVLDRTKLEGKFSRLKFVGSIEGLPPQAGDLLEEGFLAGFKKSPFYSARSGDELLIDVGGSYTFKYSEIPITKYHIQSVRVPRVKNYPAQTVSERDELRANHHIELTEYDNEVRSMPYDARFYEQSISISATYSYVAGGVNTRLEVADQTTDRGDYHKNDVPLIELEPKRKNVTNPLVWLAGVRATLVDKANEENWQEWNARYCKPGQKASRVAKMDAIGKCLEGTTDLGKFSDDRFFDLFALEFDEWAKLTGFKTDTALNGGSPN